MDSICRCVRWGLFSALYVHLNHLVICWHLLLFCCVVYHQQGVKCGYHWLGARVLDIFTQFNSTEQLAILAFMLGMPSYGT